MDAITDPAKLDALYGDPVPTSLTKVTPVITPAYRAWIEAARFVVLSTVGPEGTDASPRGDAGPVVRIEDEQTLMLPDWRGNNRIDSLRNIVRDGRASLMFMVPGTDNVVRANGTAVLTADAGVCETFEQNGHHPRSVIVFTIGELYFQCAKALMRSRLWSSTDQPKLPSAGDFIREVQPEFDGATYDRDYEKNAQPKMW